jgi:hypothetical protein
LARLLTSLCRPDHDDDQPSTLSNVEQLSLEQRKSELANNKVGEDSETANDQVRHGDERDATPYERISEGFLDLVLFVLLVPDTCLVVTDALDEETLLIFRVAFGRHGTVREEVANGKRPYTCSEAENEEQQLPVLDGTLCEVRDTEGK